MVDQWDVEHFTNLAMNGYLGRPDGTLMAFFPGLPALLRVGLELGLPIYLTGVIISAICSYLAATALARLGGPVAAVAWLFAPTAVFTIVPYTEALFCAAAFWAWERARADKWAAAAGAGRARLHRTGVGAVPGRGPGRPGDHPGDPCARRAQVLGESVAGGCCGC